MASLFFGKNPGRQIQELMKIKNRFEQELGSARSRIDIKMLPRIEKLTRQQAVKSILALKSQLAKGKAVSREKLDSLAIDDLNTALEILGLKEQIEILERKIKELQKEWQG